ncbi:MAG TPA: trypsin-like peptidase domain-containing protein [Urbifossiella sp.]|nr:trypsin-like peptidase domain-containing protein [Urbifossiella sp.]
MALIPPHDFDDRGPPRRERHSPRFLSYLLIILFAVAIAGLGVWAGSRLVHMLNPQPPATNPNEPPKPAVANGPLDAEETEANQVFESVKDSVVNVDTMLLQRGTLHISERQTGTGSGFVWDADGRIVTNYHVVQALYKHANMALRVVMADGSEHDARVVGTAADYDLAVVQILNVAKDKLKPVQLATSSDLKVGQKVFAIGNPFALSLTLTSGIISNLDRSIESPTGVPIPGAIQHTAQINPGNSGGPLLNRHGQLIGVNTSIATTSGGNVGIGFSIPSDTVNQVVTAIIRNERPLKPDLGVRLYDEKELRSAGYDSGVMIQDVLPGGPAEKAGLRGIRRGANGHARPGDIIIAINGQTVDNIRDYKQVLSKLKPGQQVKVKYQRDEEEHEATLSVRGV